MVKNTLQAVSQSLADPGEARGCSINSLVMNSVSQSASQPFPPTALRRRHAQTVRDSSSSYKIDYFIVIKNFLNPKGHQNCISGSKVTAILLKGWICPIGGSAPGACAAGLFSTKNAKKKLLVLTRRLMAYRTSL